MPAGRQEAFSSGNSGKKSRSNEVEVVQNLIY